MSSSSVQFEFALNNSARSRPTVPVAGPAAVETVERVVWKRRGAMVHAEGTGAVRRLPLAQQSWQDAVAFLELQGRRKQLPSLATYTSVMSACTRQSQWQLSITVIDRLRGQQLRPDLVAQNAELWAFAKGLQWPLVLQGLQRLSTAACSSSFGALIDLFAKGSQWQRALNLFQTQKGLQEDLVTFNLLLNACEKSSNWTIALSLLEEMPRRLVRPDVISLNTTLSSLAAVAQWRRALHLWATRRGASDERIQPTVITMNSLMIACSAAFHWEQAIHLWQGLTPYVGTSEATYGVLMETLGAPGCDWCHSVSLLESSLRQSLCNVVTFTSVLKILSTAMRWQQALALFQQMIQREVTPNLLTVHVVMTNLPNWQQATALLWSSAPLSTPGAWLALKEQLELQGQRPRAEAG
ncbi:Pentatricopeptide repeat-containing protein At2g31400 [Durusdinium trenchii]|uniref:Chloroplastic n=1 Tax=Durusdinium trenchii TaxID=1381693 RepID=A0ABP0LCS8_9DINO